ncbi:putative undecaprenyl diphosphate synthase-domain-containing protein [Ilyonectria robusta]|uniref:putative undecaprenyl diphosphate synthase-domain-containing protein n=1 Tax=Ilyonectria robusta TaxID=1079257 RepID=UPI001E8DD1E4|nr:putative undecaprenyl diphosphate synthase-domain-containing protein [Ilyonectria robusta]KAH8680410.1 putative undecaprenyl diphosphate synthase-domain-containing protein [Ilyonectria robusta]
MSFWWCLRKASCFLSHFHYSICPRTLTLDGTLDLLVSGDSRMADVSTDLYHEIFGSNHDSLFKGLPNESLRRFPDIEAHVPTIVNAKRPIYSVSRFCEEFTEVLKCSYYRGKVLHNVDQLPQHLGVIMDGNRRYSRHSGLGSVLDGHQVGAYKLLQVLSWAFSSGVRNLTVWALSDDNLKRGSQELNPLFSMMAEYIEEIVAGDAAFLVPEIRFRVVGNRSILPDHLNHMIDKAEAATSQNIKFNLQMAIGYGGRSEITRAARLVVKAKVLQEGLSVEEAVKNITEADISRQTYSAQLGLPQIDTILRTSGENRLSGFALWESHHAEFAIVEENWPELRQSTFLRSLLDLSKRNRRLGV